MQELINKMLSVDLDSITNKKRSELARYTELSDLPKNAIDMPILVDADSRVWRASYLKDGVRTKEQALETFQRSLMYIRLAVVKSHVGGTANLNALNAQVKQEMLERVNLILFFGAEGNFRKDNFKRYKLNRSINGSEDSRSATAKVADEYTDYICARCSEQIVRIPMLEADDCIGIMSDLYDNNAIIWSPDKDLSTIPGIRAHDEQGVLTVRKVTPMQAQLNRFLQYMVGDTSDGYTGIPGVFSKEVYAYMSVLEQHGKLLTDSEMTELVVGLYKNIMGNSIEEYARKTINVASILRQHNVTETSITTVAGDVIALA